MHPQDEIEVLICAHKEAPHYRTLQKELAKYLTTWVHGEAKFEKVFEMSDYLFRVDWIEKLSELDETDFRAIFSGKPQVELDDIDLDMISALASNTQFLPSNKEASRALQENSVSVNGNKVDSSYQIGEKDLLLNKFIIIQRGKKKHFLIVKK